MNSYTRTGDISQFLGNSTKTKKELKGREDSRRPWDQLPDEPGAAYAAFLLYVDMGSERSHSNVAKILYGNSASTGRPAAWSKTHDWVNRAEAWDRFHAETRLARMEQAHHQAEDIMLDYYPRAIETLCKAAIGEVTIARTQAQMLNSYLDRVGLARASKAPVQVNNTNIQLTAPDLPGEVQADTELEVDADFEVIEEQAAGLIPKDLKK